MNPMFEIAKTNYIGYFDPEQCSEEKFKPWIRFLNDHSLVRRAITLSVPLNILALRALYTTATNSPDGENQRLAFKIGENEYLVTEHDINRILGFPTEGHVPVPSAQELINFFQTISYQGPMNMVKLSKAKLVSKWDYFFDTLARVFGPTLKSGFTNIPLLLQNFGYAVANNLQINFGKLILAEILRKMGPPLNRVMNGQNMIKCYYPRFLMLFILDKLSVQDKSLFLNSPVQVSPTTTNMFSRLANQNKFPNVQVITTPYMSRFINPPAGQQAEQQEPEQPVVQAQQDEVLPEAEQPAPAEQEQVNEVVVDFTASWCGPCRFIAPVLAEFAKKIPNVLFLKVDIDELATVAKEWSIEAMPTFIFLKDGNLVDKVVGARKDDLHKTIIKHAADTAPASASV